MSESFVVELRVSCFGEKTSRCFMKNKPSFCGKLIMDGQKSGRGEKEGWERWNFYGRGRGVNISC